MLSSLPSHLLQQLGLSHEILENELSKFMNVEEMKVSLCMCGSGSTFSFSPQTQPNLLTLYHLLYTMYCRTYRDFNYNNYKQESCVPGL